MSDISFSTPFETGATKLGPVGYAHREDSTGRAWRYSLAGASNLGRGKLAVSATIVSAHSNISFTTAPAAGATKVAVTLGATLVAANFYQDGFLVNQDGTGEGRAYPIEGHPAAALSTSVVIDLKEAIDTTGAISETNVDLVLNRWAGLVISVTDQADPVAGVPNVAITAAQYGWTQTYGPCSVWFDEAVTAGFALTIGTGTAGQVEMLDAAGEPLLGHVGANAGVDTEYQLVDLCIAY